MLGGKTDKAKGNCKYERLFLNGKLGVGEDLQHSGLQERGQESWAYPVAFEG